MNEAIRIHADWLAHEEFGVAALLATVPRYAGDPAPVPPTAIYDRARHGWVARGAAPRDAHTVTYPALAVTIADAAKHSPSSKEMGGNPVGGARVLAGTVPVAVQYLARDPESADAARDASYVLRAVRGSLLALARRPARERQANGIELTQLIDLRTFHGPVSVHDVVISDLVVALWTTRETTP